MVPIFLARVEEFRAVVALVSPSIPIGVFLVSIRSLQKAEQYSLCSLEIGCATNTDTL